MFGWIVILIICVACFFINIGVYIVDENKSSAREIIAWFIAILCALKVVVLLY